MVLNSRWSLDKFVKLVPRVFSLLLMSYSLVELLQLGASLPSKWWNLFLNFSSAIPGSKSSIRETCADEHFFLFQPIGDQLECHGQSRLCLINIWFAKNPWATVVYMHGGKTLVETSTHVLLNLVNYQCMSEHQVPPMFTTSNMLIGHLPQTLSHWSVKWKCSSVLVSSKHEILGTV